MEPASFDQIKAWLLAYEECVNTLNYSRARELFSDMCRVMGIHVAFVDRLDDVIEKEFQKEWPNIADFSWNHEKRVVMEAENPYLGTMFLGWSATGHRADGKPFNRAGSATLIFMKAGGQPIRCFHMNIRLNPNVPFRTYRLDALVEPAPDCP